MVKTNISGFVVTVQCIWCYLLTRAPFMFWLSRMVRLHLVRERKQDRVIQLLTVFTIHTKNDIKQYACCGYVPSNFIAQRKLPHKISILFNSKLLVDAILRHGIGTCCVMCCTIVWRHQAIICTNFDIPPLRSWQNNWMCSGIWHLE